MASPKKVTPSGSKPVAPVRHYKGQTEVDHDLFKLEVASTKKNIGLPHAPRWEDAEHTHFFHTYDSKGKKMTYSASISGHCHEVTVENVDGKLVAKCGPPVRKYKNNRVEKLPDHDQHTHDVTYLYSEKVEARKLNEQAMLHLSKYSSPADPR